MRDYRQADQAFSASRRIARFWAQLSGFALVVLLTINSSPAHALTADEILAAMDKNRDYRTVTYTGTMEIQTGGEIRTKNMKVQGEGDSKAVVEFTNPQDQGVKYLKINKDLWIYFPSEQDVVKISGHMLKEGMMGSDVSYEDALESDAVKKKYKAAIIGEDSLDGHACHVIELEAITKDAPYYKRKMWIDKSLLLPRKEEMYAKSGKLLKESHVLEVKEIGARHYPVRVEMINKLRKDSKTVFTMQHMTFDAALPASLFSLQNLQR